MQVSAQRELRELIQRIENLQQQQRELGADIKDLLTEAKSKGYVPAIIRKVLAIRKKTRAEHEAEEAVIASYMMALGMDGTPMGDYVKAQDRVLEAAE